MMFIRNNKVDDTCKKRKSTNYIFRIRTKREITDQEHWYNLTNLQITEIPMLELYNSQFDQINII